jgi:hypothetical protein
MLVQLRHARQRARQSLVRLAKRPRFGYEATAFRAASPPAASLSQAFQGPDFSRQGNRSQWRAS